MDARERAEFARQVSAQRQIIDHYCPICGEWFDGLKTAVYCSPACRTKAWRQRKREHKEK